MGSRGGHCYYELGSLLWSHAFARRPTGAQTEESHTNELVGSREVSIPAERADRVWSDTGPNGIV